MDINDDYLNENLDVTEEVSQYDNNAKILLSSNVIRAWILSLTYQRYSWINAEMIRNMKDGVLLSDQIQLQIQDQSEEKRMPEMGRIITDNSFLVTCIRKKEGGDDEKKTEYFDFEMMNTMNTRYPIPARGIYGLCRRIDMQGGKDFSLSRQEYDRIRVVNSLWIIFSSPHYQQDTSLNYRITGERNHGEGEILQGHDLMSMKIVCVPEDGKTEDPLTRFLYAILTNNLTANEKKQILEKEFGIILPKEEHEMLGTIYGLGAGIARDSIAKGIEIGEARGIEIGETKGINIGKELMRKEYSAESAWRMHRAGLSDLQIAKYLDISLEEVHTILAGNEDIDVER
jgi:hypothetical protein